MNASTLTWLIWAFAAAIGAVAFWKVRPEKRDILTRACRVSFGGCVALGVWTGAVYALWLMDVPLTVGAIDNGQIGRNWWLPSAIILWAGFSYWTLKRKDQ